MPAGVPDHVNDAAQLLADAVDDAENALMERLDGKADAGLERSFDVLVDRVWVALRARLEFWQVYRHEGLDLLSAEELTTAKVEAHRKLSRVAEELLARLFGDGVDFLRVSYPQQAAHMAARLRYIESHGLQAEFVELVGAAPASLAQVCQRRYEAMVAARTARDNAVSVNLRPLRAKIRWAAENYASLLISTLPKGDAEWSETVLAALQPMLANDTTRSKTDAEEAPDAGGDLEGVETPAAGDLVDSEPPPVNPPAEGE
ncbi:hypothetical protein DB30_06036 [Enhygromyxa salina]|uniref:Uncharacterized protein n=2 Tax=Enhygromyxa salina TaxID=215803 RepID=A0A0C1ZVP6_9BACT|nr:hypothetical protein DB30_06036 [Enhygromyxa salina]